MRFVQELLAFINEWTVSEWCLTECDKRQQMSECADWVTTNKYLPMHQRLVRYEYADENLTDDI